MPHRPGTRQARRPRPPTHPLTPPHVTCIGTSLADPRPRRAQTRCNQAPGVAPVRLQEPRGLGQAERPVIRSVLTSPHCERSGRCRHPARQRGHGRQLTRGSASCCANRLPRPEGFRRAGHGWGQLLRGAGVLLGNPMTYATGALRPRERADRSAESLAAAAELDRAERMQAEARSGGPLTA